MHVKPLLPAPQRPFCVEEDVEGLAEATVVADREDILVNVAGAEADGPRMKLVETDTDCVDFGCTVEAAVLVSVAGGILVLLWYTYRASLQDSLLPTKGQSHRRNE